MVNVKKEKVCELNKLGKEILILQVEINIKVI